MAQKEDKYVVKVRFLDRNGECIKGYYVATDEDGIKETGTPCHGVKSYFTREQAYEFCKLFKKAHKGESFETKPMQVNVAMRDYYNYGIKVGAIRDILTEESFKDFTKNYF